MTKEKVVWINMNNTGTVYEVACRAKEKKATGVLMSYKNRLKIIEYLYVDNIEEVLNIMVSNNSIQDPENCLLMFDITSDDNHVRWYLSPLIQTVKDEPEFTYMRTQSLSFKVGNQ